MTLHGVQLSEVVDAQHEEGIRAFIVGHPESTYCHRAEWRGIVESAYGLDTKQISLHRDSECIAVLSAVVMPTLLAREKRAVSQAFCNYGDILVKPGEDQDELRAACLQYLASQGLRKVEVRKKTAAPGESDEVTLILELPENADILWRQVGDKVRNQIRKAEKTGLVTRWGKEQIGELYDIYAANMGRLGTPVHAREFFEAIVAKFGDDADVLTVRLEDKAIGGMLLIKHRDTWADPFASSLPGYQRHNPNMLLYWEALRRACGQGVRFFDFGRSHAGSGTDRFKRQWGALAYPLDYRTYIDGIATDAASTKLYRGSAGRLVSMAWQKLPQGLQRRLGPKLRRHIP